MRQYLVNAMGFMLLSFFALMYYGLVYFQLPSFFAGIAFFAGMIMFFTGMLAERKLLKRGNLSSAQKIGTVVFVLIGGMATFALSGYETAIGSIGPVVAASAIGLVGYEILNKLKAVEFAAPLYCGAFVGMSSGMSFSFEIVALASLISGAVYIIARELYAGSGGKLGTMAFIGTTVIRNLFG